MGSRSSGSAGNLTAKAARLLLLLRSLQGRARCSLKDLEKVTGKLLWLSSVYRSLRPALCPLYVDQQRPVPVMAALNREAYSRLRAVVSDSGVVQQSCAIPSCPPGSRILRINQTWIQPSAALPPEAAVSDRTWVQVADPGHPDRVLSEASRHLHSP